MKTFKHSAPVFALLLALTALAAGCGLAREIKHEDYQKASALNFSKGMEEFNDRSLEDARFYFNVVVTKYTMSKYAFLAELRIADIAFLNDSFMEASDAYLRYNKEHPSHPCAAYSVYMAAMSSLMQAPENWWFMPPAEERDQRLIEEAYDNFRKFLIMMKALDNPPKDVKDEIDESEAINFDDKGFCQNEDKKLYDELVKSAHIKLKWCGQRLLEREMYVAKFYYRDDKPQGTIARIKGVMKDKRFIERGLDKSPELLKLMIKAYIAKDDLKEACPYLGYLIKASPSEGKSTRGDFPRLAAICDELEKKAKDEAKDKPNDEIKPEKKDEVKPDKEKSLEEKNEQEALDKKMQFSPFKK